MIDLDDFKKLIEQNDDRLPLLTLNEFFEGNTKEDSIAPNGYGFGRPPISEIWKLLQDIEKMEDIAWIRIQLHDDTEILEYNGKEILILAGESPIICTSLTKFELESFVNCEWLHSGGIEECRISSIDSLFSSIPSIPNGFRCFEIMWD